VRPSNEFEQYLLDAFLEHVPDNVYFKDRESRFVRISRSLASRFGLKDPSQAIGKTDFDMFSEEHARLAFADEQQILRTGKPLLQKEERETWPDGRETWVLTSKLPLRDKQGAVIGTMGISRDITERKRTEQELNKHRARLEELVAKRTAQLSQANELLELDIARRKITEQELARKAKDLATANAELENLSLIDDLTGLHNRRGFLTLAEHRIKLAVRTGEPFSIVFVDLDGLKQINDSWGHEEGDRALGETANVLRSSFRASDILARIGGDEFAVFVSEADETSIAGRIRGYLHDLNLKPGRSYALSLSLGVVLGASAENSAASNDIGALLGQADALMYREKRRKRRSRLASSPAKHP
jgi:diguanylate cyclase (GGDEF)-like protein/PAS domain S-box-containing protein